MNDHNGGRYGIDNAYILPDDDGCCDIVEDESEPIDCYGYIDWSDAMVAIAGSGYWPFETVGRWEIISAECP